MCLLVKKNDKQYVLSTSYVPSTVTGLREIKVRREYLANKCLLCARRWARRTEPGAFTYTFSFNQGQIKCSPVFQVQGGGLRAQHVWWLELYFIGWS